MLSIPWQPKHDIFLNSLQSLLAKLYNKAISKVIMKAKKILHIPATPDVSFLVTDQEQADHHKQLWKKPQNNDRFPVVLFAVAGSGKTQSIISFMAANWGHYLVSGRILDSLTHQNSILSPRRGGASSDTQWLFELFERVKTKRLRFRRLDVYFFAILKLLENRQTLLDTWYKSTDTNPSYWLLLQTTCTPKYDPFKDTLKLRMLVERATEMETFPSLPTIIDEAQNELDPFWSDKAPLTDFIDAGHELEHMVSISGTSLRIKECQKVVDENIFQFTLPQNSED